MNRKLFSSRGGPAPLGRVPASARLYDELRRRIVALELPPDSTLDRSEIAGSFGVSQSPVREAILRLEQEGLVVSYPQSRTVVTRIDVSRIHEEHFLRRSCECEVVRQLALTANAGVVVKAQGLLRMQAALVDDVKQADLFKQLDEAFHEALFAGADQASLHAHVTSHCGHLARVRTLDLPRRDKMRAVLDGHQAVVDAIVAGDPAAAAETMRTHLSGTMSRLPRLIQEHPDFFS